MEMQGVQITMLMIEMLKLYFICLSNVYFDAQRSAGLSVLQWNFEFINNTAPTMYIYLFFTHLRVSFAPRLDCSQPCFTHSALPYNRKRIYVA